MYETDNAFTQNYPKLVCMLLFSVSITPDGHQLFDAVLQSCFSAFKAQIGAAYLFENNFKPFETKGMADKWLAQIAQIQVENVASTQLQFLRVAAAMKLIITASQSQQEGSQLGLDTAKMQLLDSQTDDLAEFNTLIEFLGLKTDFTSLFAVP